jgi:hypothetical protein
MDDNQEVFFTDSVFHPPEHDLDNNADAGFQETTFAESKKAAPKKPIVRDFSNQKKITQKARQLIEEDALIRITKSIKKPKPGQLSCGVRRMRHDVVALSKLAPEIQTTVIGPSKLKVSEKAKFERTSRYFNFNSKRN